MVLQHPSLLPAESTARPPVHQSPPSYMESDLFPEIIMQAAKPTGRDSAVSAFAMRLVVGMADPSVRDGLTTLVTEVAEERPMGSSHLFNLILRAIQKQALEKRPDDYPRGISPRCKGAVPLWDELIHDTIGARESGAWAELRDDVMTRQPVTNEVQRLIGPAFLEGLLGSLPVAVEAGCSQNLIGKAMATGWHVGGVAVSASLNARKPRRDARLSADVAELVDTRSDSLRIGVDINNMDDPDTLAWFAASPYPGELLNKKKMEARRYLQGLVLPETQLQFHQLDFTDPAQVDAFMERLRETEWRLGIPHNDARYVYLITSAYEAPEMIAAAKRVAGPEGVVVIQDFAETDPEDNTKVRFRRHWPEWGYRLLALQMKYADRGWQPVMRARTSRLKEIALDDGELMVDGKPVKIIDLVARASLRPRDAR